MNRAIEEITLELKDSKTYQKLIIPKCPPDHYFAPKSLKGLKLPEGVDYNRGMVIDGAAPNWLYAYLAYQFQGVAWLGCYYPQLQDAVVIHTHTPKVRAGQLKNSAQIKEDNETGYLKLAVSELETETGEHYQSLIINAFTISPNILEFLLLPENLDWERGILLWGQAPIWLYAYLVVRCQQAPWIACYNQRTTESVVVFSKCNQFVSGDQFQLAPHSPCSAIIIGGPPDSGKGVLGYYLKKTLLAQGLSNKIYLHRVAWDGEGDWFAELMPKNSGEARKLSKQKGRWVKPENLDQYFATQAEVINNIRGYTDLVLVDLGGQPGAADRIMLNSCTDYIIISRFEDKVQEWHDFFQTQKNLLPLAVIHSVLEEKIEVIREEPLLEIIAGSWDYHRTKTVPTILLEKVKQIVLNLT